MLMIDVFDKFMYVVPIKGKKGRGFGEWDD